MGVACREAPDHHVAVGTVIIEPVAVAVALTTCGISARSPDVAAGAEATTNFAVGW
jgi:hypothetical protein